MQRFLLRLIVGIFALISFGSLAADDGLNEAHRNWLDKTGEQIQLWQFLATAQMINATNQSTSNLLALIPRLPKATMDAANELRKSAEDFSRSVEGVFANAEQSKNATQSAGEAEKHGDTLRSIELQQNAKAMKDNAIANAKAGDKSLAVFHAQVSLFLSAVMKAQQRLSDEIPASSSAFDKERNKVGLKTLYWAAKFSLNADDMRPFFQIVPLAHFSYDRLTPDESSALNNLAKSAKEFASHAEKLDQINSQVPDFKTEAEAERFAAKVGLNNSMLLVMKKKVTQQVFSLSHKIVEEDLRKVDEIISQADGQQASSVP